MLGSCPLLDALVKSVASWLSSFAAVVLPFDWAVWAAFCRFVLILRGNLFVFYRVRLLKLLQRAQQLG